MTRAVVFRSPGKLDLRSITIFGLNAKPNSSNPIGFFGTGLKYALAVCVRNKLPITIWVGSQKWTVEPKDTNFRGKDFQGIVLKRHKKLLPPTTIALPFTTELGKTWELWQAFRELYANTLDEDGATSVVSEFPDDWVKRLGNQTVIMVEGEAFVQEYLEREKSFLPDALRQQTTSEPVQKFDRPSTIIYWRGMRVHDLKEPSLYTWNILKSIDLTEDRTAKYQFQINVAIEEYVRNHAPKEVISNIVMAPHGKYEHKLEYDYHYTAPSTDFIEAVKEAPKDNLTDGARKHAAAYIKEEPKSTPTYTKDELFDKLIRAIDISDFTTVEETIEYDRDFVLDLLRMGKDAYDANEAHPYIPEDEPEGPTYEVIDPLEERTPS